MAKTYEVLLDTPIAGGFRLAGSTVVVSDDDAPGYIRAGLIKGDAPEDEPVKPAAKKAVKE